MSKRTLKTKSAHEKLKVEVQRYVPETSTQSLINHGLIKADIYGPSVKASQSFICLHTLMITV